MKKVKCVSIGHGCPAHCPHRVLHEPIATAITYGGEKIPCDEQPHGCNVLLFARGGQKALDEENNAPIDDYSVFIKYGAKTFCE